MWYTKKVKEINIMAKNETIKKSTKVIAVINKDRKYYPAYVAGGDVMKAGTRYECRGDRYIDKDGELVLSNYLGHGWHEVVPPVDFDLFLEETVTVTTKTVTTKPAMIKGKHIVPVVPEAAE